MFAIYESFYYGLHPSYFTFTVPSLNLNSCQASLIKWLPHQQWCEVVLSLNVWFQLDTGLAIVLCKDVIQRIERRVFVVCFFQNISNAINFEGTLAFAHISIADICTASHFPQFQFQMLPKVIPFLWNLYWVVAAVTRSKLNLLISVVNNNTECKIVHL